MSAMLDEALAQVLMVDIQELDLGFERHFPLFSFKPYC
jgi:hypothetical protein